MLVEAPPSRVAPHASLIAAPDSRVALDRTDPHNWVRRPIEDFSEGLDLPPSDRVMLALVR